MPVLGVRSVILCEDIREEIGSKKSLMGVLPGDVTIGAFPATIQISVYVEYAPIPEDGEHLSIKLRMILADVDVATGGVESDVFPDQVVVFALPRGLLTIQTETRLRILISVNGRTEQEILNRRIIGVPPTS